jgi:hypothetical protein
MHDQAYQWVARWAAEAADVDVLDVGGRDVNGTVRELFTDARTYTGVDLYPGDGVDWVGDFLDYQPDWSFGAILHLEVAEHTPDWRKHLAHARDLLAPDGLLIFTAAGPGRAPHSAVTGRTFRRTPRLGRGGEYYENVDPGDLADTLSDLFTEWQLDEAGTDVRAIAYARGA